MSDTSTAAIAVATSDAAPDARVPGFVTLDHPITLAVGGAQATAISVRKPNSGELRGLTLMALSQLDTDALRKLLPRITTPRLTVQDIDALDPADFMQLGGEVMDFLLPRDAKPDSLKA